MTNQKKNFEHLQRNLSRTEMKKILGGTGTECVSTCLTSKDCTADRSCLSAICPDGTHIKSCLIPS
jgi:hypothetical protein